MRMAKCAALAACLTVPIGAFAFDLVLPAGLACPTFARGLTALNGGHQQSIEVTNGARAGMTLLAGQSYDLQLTNVATGASYTVKGRGGLNKGGPNGDGTWSYQFSGNYVLVWFPEDDTSGQGDFGPATWVTTGNIKIQSGSQFNGPWVLTSSSGRRIDICALLG